MAWGLAAGVLLLAAGGCSTAEEEASSDASAQPAQSGEGTLAETAAPHPQPDVPPAGETSSETPTSLPTVQVDANAPTVVGKGMNPLAFAPAIEAGDREAILEMLQPLGDCPEVPEEQLEAYAINAAMGPTYFWPKLYELKSLAESFGLSEQAAMEAVDKMLWATVATMKDSGLSAEQVQDLIPVKPMAEETAALAAAYRQKLTGLMEKIRP